MKRNEGQSNKYYCEVCKIWIENNSNNIRIHIEGGRHRYNQRKLLKIENYKELKRKKEEEEIRQEFLKLQGISNRSEPKNTIKSLDKYKGTHNFKSNIFIPNYEQTSYEILNEQNSEQEPVLNRRGETTIGKWEEVDKSESVFSNNINKCISNPFINKEKNIELVRSTNSLNFEYDFDEYDFKEVHNSNAFSDNKSNEKIKINFNKRKKLNKKMNIES